MKRLAAAAVVLVSQPFTASARAPQQPDKPVSELGAILQELRAIRLLLERPTTAPAPERDPSTPTTLPALKGPFFGDERAPLTMVEFSDLQCPFCQRFSVEVFGQLKRDWIDTGRIRYFVIDFPLDFHLQARGAAHAVRCAGEQSRAWEMRALLGQNAASIRNGVGACQRTECDRRRGCRGGGARRRI
jgi:protein-disulfide isomerase